MLWRFILYKNVFKLRKIQKSKHVDSVTIKDFLFIILTIISIQENNGLKQEVIDLDDDDDEDENAVASQNTAEQEQADEEPVIDITINNVVCSFSVCCHLDLRNIALTANNVEFRRENGVSYFFIIFLKLKNWNVL